MTKHLRLTNEQFLYLHHTLKDAQFRVYLFLSTLNPFSDSHIEVDTAVISEHLGLHRRTVQSALHELSKLDLIQVSKFKLRVFAPKSNDKSSDLQTRQGESRDRQGESRDRQGESRDRQGESRDRRQLPESLPSADSGSSQTIQTIQTLSNCTRENLREESFENFDQENPENEKNVESVEQALKIVQENLKTTSEPTEIPNETTPESANSGVDRNYAGPPPEKFFKTLRDFVIYEAKQDPKINSPEIWANTCLARNPEEWQAKWDAWERSRNQTAIGLPEKVEIDFEKSKKAMEEARKLLPAWMRRDRG
ncbi:helix-turn-helix domain-containing protein [Pseudanabaena sp. 'Roaring Creek']|uniref:helix-turn-helix domain-containing protein n=1 Tax=Pseudanabaena sp. 'Roaring Creek' TaxID=1681830 RepID=UPI0006D7881B|nr:helix-turn-helix domain-containing protein [Pseudanabaena sp. 'Roaring Creek']